MSRQVIWQLLRPLWPGLAQDAVTGRGRQSLPCKKQANAANELRAGTSRGLIYGAIQTVLMRQDADRSAAGQGRGLSKEAIMVLLSLLVGWVRWQRAGEFL